MERWRPPDWAKIRSSWLEKNFTTGKMKQNTFEAGADAMLRELETEREIRDITPNLTQALEVLNSLPQIGQKGHWAMK